MGERDGGGGVVDVEADADDEGVVAAGVGGVDEDAADFDVVCWGVLVCGGGGTRRIESVDVVRPFQFDGQFIVAAFIIRPDPCDDGEGSEVLDEHHRRLVREREAVPEHNTKHQTPRRRNPDVRPARPRPATCVVAVAVKPSGRHESSAGFFSSSVFVLVTTSP